MNATLPSTSDELYELRASVSTIRLATWESLSKDARGYACRRDRSYSYLTEIYAILSEALDDIDQANYRLQQLEEDDPSKGGVSTTLRSSLRK